MSLDEEAIRLVQLQSSYQAASKVVTVIDQLHAIAHDHDSSVSVIEDDANDEGDLMISGLSPSNDQFLASLNILQNNLSQADEQLSSGLRVNQASDAPQSIQDIFVDPRRTRPGQSEQRRT